jgi:long-chain fatty acid transport protein
MAMIGSRTDFSFQGFFPKREMSFDFGGGTTEGGSRFYLVPAIGWTAPVNTEGDLYFGGGMYGVSGMGVDYDTVSAPFAAGYVGVGAQAHIYSQYQFWKMAPTLAWKSSTFAIGFALNLDYQALGFENYFTGPGGMYGQWVGFDLSEMQGALGAGATIGVLYQPVPAFAVGLSYSSRQYFTDFKWRLSAGDVIWDGLMSKDGTYTMNLDFPQQAAVGFAVRPFRTVLLTADAKWINYSDTYDVVKLKGDFTVVGPTTGPDVLLNFGWRDIWVYATAVQIDVTPNLSLRAGYNYSTSPIEREDVENNLAFPAIVKRQASGGFTYRLGRNWELTMAYMKALKEELIGVSGTKISLEEDAGDIEISYRF